MLTYLDNASTSYPKPMTVTDANRYAMLHYTSPNRGTHQLAINSSEALFETREMVANFLNIKDSSHLIFTPGGTHSINYVINGLDWQENEVAVISSLEHNAVYRPLLNLQKTKNINLEIIPYSKHQGFELYDLEKVLIKGNVKLVAITHASNVTGEILPLRKVIELTRKYNTKLLVDGSQTVGNFNIDLQELDVDFFAFSGHKYLLGPSGVGFLYIKNKTALTPTVFGGTGLDSLSEEMPQELPDRFEAGTINLPAIWAMNSAITYIKSEGLTNIYNSRRELIMKAVENIEHIDHVKCYSSGKNNVGIISFNIEGMEPQKVATILANRYNICVRYGLHCSPLAHTAIGTDPEGCVRISISCLNTKNDVKVALTAIKEIASKL